MEVWGVAGALGVEAMAAAGAMLTLMPGMGATEVSDIQHYIKDFNIFNRYSF